MNTPVASSRSFWFTPVVATLASAFLLYLLVLNARQVGSTPYVQLDTLLTLGLFGGGLLACFMILYNWPIVIHVYPDRIEKRMIGHRRAFPWRSVSWVSFRPTRGKYGAIDTCTVVCKGRSIAFNQHSRNFSDLRAAVEYYRAENNIRLDNQRWFSPANQRVIVSLFVLIIGLMLMQIKKPKENTDALKTLRLTLARPAWLLHQPTKSRPAYGVAFKTREYPAFEFRYGEEQYLQTQKALLQLSAGEQIEIQVSEDIFLKKIARSKTPDFWEKHVQWSQIGVYGIQYEDKNLMLLPAD